MIHVYFADASPLEDDKAYSRMYCQMSEYRRAKADRFSFRKDRDLCLAASVLIDCGLREYGLREADINYAVNDNGKPYFPYEPQIHFNLSHSGSKVMVCFSDSELGCDIEKIESSDTEIARRFFHPNEYSALLSVNRREADDYFYTLWTLKESYIKLLGTGMSRPLNSFEIKLCGDSAVVEVGEGNTPGVHLHILDACPGYKAAICSAAEAEEDKLIIEYVQL